MDKIIDRQQYKKMKNLINQFELELEIECINNDLMNMKYLHHNHSLYGFKIWLLDHTNFDNK